MNRPYRNYSDEVLAWWVNHMENGCPMCPSTTPPDVAARVREEFARRNTNRKPRTERKRHA